jgi:hypothetical protein
MPFQPYQKQKALASTIFSVYLWLKNEQWRANPNVLLSQKSPQITRQLTLILIIVTIRLSARIDAGFYYINKIN